VSGILDLPRTIMLRRRAVQFETFASLAELADAYMHLLQDGEAKMAANRLTDTEWTNIAETAEALAEICGELESWMAEHGAALIVEVEAIRADIRKLTPITIDEDSDEQA
jgi:uncharacterized protein YgfB (UPF0149 family)